MQILSTSYSFNTHPVDVHQYYVSQIQGCRCLIYCQDHERYQNNIIISKRNADFVWHSFKTHLIIIPRVENIAIKICASILVLLFVMALLIPSFFVTFFHTYSSMYRQRKHISATWTTNKTMLMTVPTITPSCPGLSGKVSIKELILTLKLLCINISYHFTFLLIFMPPYFNNLSLYAAITSDECYAWFYL